MVSAEFHQQPSPYSDISKKLGLKENLPYTENWSAAADFVSILADYCLAEKPITILECSSGLTTLVLARCCQINGHGHVFSLENGEQYVAKTQAELDAFSLSQQASVLHAPLITSVTGEGEFQWYDREELAVLTETVDMLVIDGPPGFIQPQSRYPALPLLASHLAEDVVIFLDDAARDDEKRLVTRWLEQFPSLQHLYYETQRGCSILSSRSIVPGLPGLQSQV